MTKKRWAILLILISIPLMWWGFNQFIYGSGHSTLQEIFVSVSCTGGLTCFFGGLYLLFTKDRGVLLASQTNVGDSSVQKEMKRAYQHSVAQAQKEIINKKPKVNEMAKAKDTNIDKSVEEIRALEENLVQSEEIIKKETLNTKTTTEKIAVLKHDLAKDKTVKELLAIVTDYQLKQ